MSTGRSIFISYRRDDSAIITGILYERLVCHFGEQSVFMDVDSIPLGVDFQQFLDYQVSQCQLFIAVIGSGWIDAKDEDGNRRLDSEEDFVRIEIESALARGIPVVPLILSPATLPSKSNLPKSLQQLVKRNGMHLRAGQDFNRDIERLIKGIQAHFNQAEQSTAKQTSTGAAPPSPSTPTTIKKQPAPTPKPPNLKDEFANLPARYQTLKDHLANGRWQKADETTFKVMLEVAGQTQQGYLDEDDIKQFPCEELRTIDRLWVKFSNGRFGFSVQKKIYIEAGNKPDGEYYKKEYLEFCDRVGWRENGKWLSYSELTFTTSAKGGHLPAVAVFGRGWRWRWVTVGFCEGRGVGCSSLVQRLVKCSATR